MADGSGGGDGDGPAPQADAATPTAIMASTRLRPAPRPGTDGPRSGSVTGRLLGGMRAGGRGAAWTDERGTSEEARRCLRGALRRAVSTAIRGYPSPSRASSGTAWSATSWRSLLRPLIAVPNSRPRATERY